MNGNNMELGTGIFLSALFIGTVLLFIATKDRWNWKKMLLYLFSTAILVLMLGGGASFLYSKYQQRPVVQSELIGLRVRVCGKKIEGKIIDETKNMFIVECEEGMKKTIKNSNEFEFELNNQKLKVEGNKLVGRPEERIKKNG